MQNKLCLKNKIIETCKIIEKERLVIGTWGNVSVRFEDNYIITPSKIKYEQMKASDLVLIDEQKNILEGNKNPSSETELHLEIYRRRKDVNSIIHSHSNYASVFAVCGASIPPIIEEQTQIIGGEIKCTPQYIRAGEHESLAKITADTLGNFNAVLISNHGVVCCGRDIEEALTVARVVEKTAKVYLLSKLVAEVKIIPQKEVKAERDRFLYKYGKEFERK